MHPAGKVLEVAGRATAFAVDGEPIQGGGVCIARPRSFIPDIGPEPGSLGLSRTRSLHLHGRIVGEDRLSVEHMPADSFSQRLQQRRRPPDPISQGRAFQVDPVPLEDL